MGHWWFYVMIIFFIKRKTGEKSFRSVQLRLDARSVEKHIESELLLHVMGCNYVVYARNINRCYILIHQALTLIWRTGWQQFGITKSCSCFDKQGLPAAAAVATTRHSSPNCYCQHSSHTRSFIFILIRQTGFYLHIPNVDEQYQITPTSLT